MSQSQSPTTFHFEGQVALDREGHFLAFRFEDTTDLGAYAAFASTLVGTRNLSVSMGGAYRVPALHMSSRLAYTNAVAVGSGKKASAIHSIPVFRCMVAIGPRLTETCRWSTSSRAKSRQSSRPNK